MQKLGQHFLTAPAIAAQIVAASETTGKDTVLEIGAGRGMLTRALAKRARRVVAVEKDARLFLALQSAMSMPGVAVVHGDIRDLLADRTFRKTLRMRYRVVANIPYYLTGRLFLLLLQKNPQLPKSITLLVQQEVAERVCAHPPRMNLLALGVQAYGAPRIVRRVSRRAFVPPPTVDSAVLHIADVSRAFFTAARVREELFFVLARTAFGKKRKQLRHSLRPALGAQTDGALALCGIAEKRRPETLLLQDWACLAKHAHPYGRTDSIILTRG